MPQKEFVNVNGVLVEKPPQVQFDGRLSLYVAMAEFSGRCRWCGKSIKLRIRMPANLPTQFWPRIIADRLAKLHDCEARAEYANSKEYMERHLKDMVIAAEKAEEAKDKANG